nr:OFA family MFS transporter [uncultured Ligilactobacillus sp.]
MFKKRNVVAFAGVVFHLMIGSVYAWSVFSKPIVAATHWSESAVSFAFSLAIFCLGMSAAFMGKAVEKFGPTATGVFSSIFFGAGIALTGLSIHLHSLPLLYLGYGIIGGIGLGAGYVTPVSTIVKWFPDRRGLAAGLAIMGFGFASLVTSPIAQYLMDTVGLVNTFYILGLAYFVVMITASFFIKKPKENELPKTMNEKMVIRSTYLNGKQFTANEAVKTRSFRLLWLMFFINITCGIGLVSAASPMAQSMTGMSVAKATIMVGIIGLFNGFGRLAWATLSDYIGRPNTFSLIFITDIVMLILMLIFKLPMVFTVALCLLLSCYGAGFSVIPAYLSDVFGTKELGAIHGYALTAWAVAGLVGPVLLSVTHQILHTYTVTITVFVIIDLLALLVSYYIRKDFVAEIRNMQEEM